MLFVLQETDNWKASEMSLLGRVFYGLVTGKTAILCSRQLCQVRLSWERYDRCTASLTGSMMVLLVFMPHDGRDEEVYITECACGGYGIQVDIRGDSKTVVDWINGKGRERAAKGANGGIQSQPVEGWGRQG